MHLTLQTPQKSCLSKPAAAQLTGQLVIPMSMNDLIKYVADLEITQGRLAGEYFRPLPWQKLFMRGAFGPNVATAALSVGRGNGKTALLSGIACATLDGPLTVPRGETLIVASTFEQARIAFEHVVAFMGPSVSLTGTRTGGAFGIRRSQRTRRGQADRSARSRSGVRSAPRPRACAVLDTCR